MPALPVDPQRRRDPSPRRLSRRILRATLSYLELAHFVQFSCLEVGVGNETTFAAYPIAGAKLEPGMRRRSQGHEK